ncbi:MAG: cysteine--tRNA ligase [Candidatus Levybacteria bacterium]|nr:cysteine--tRNA ligase [Candidatus Levybacteria bacterium]
MKLFNTLTKSKDEFKPLDENEVKMYVCGITPYDTTHLGHAFTYTAFDVLYRFLDAQGYQINYTQNVTDIDDDILKKAKQVKKDWQELGTFWTDKYVADMKTLNNVPPTHYVKATETIPTIIAIIRKLDDDNMAYAKNGNVYYRVSKNPDYGKISAYTREQMITLSKERGANPSDPNKEDPLDFILWQKSLPGEPSWDSPWGKGRPGWHIECSAMIYKFLGAQIDIHGGGSDLIYPHHESEIAQSEQFTGKHPFSQFWMHTGAVMYEGEKMSKSLGNLVMVSELLKTYSANAIKYVLLSHHYRIPWEYRQKELDAAQRAMDTIEETIKAKPMSPGSDTSIWMQQFTDALADDLDTPKALGTIIELVEEQNANPTATNQETLMDMAEVLGFRTE